MTEAINSPSMVTSHHLNRLNYRNASLYNLDETHLKHELDLLEFQESIRITEIYLEFLESVRNHGNVSGIPGIYPESREYIKNSSNLSGITGIYQEF